MRGIKKVLMVLLILLLFGAVAAGMIWHANHYVMIDFTFYSKDAETLDLRGQEISIQEYEKICRHLPDCDVQWDVPLSSGSVAEDTRSLTVTSLTDRDVTVLDYLTELDTVEAEGCTDYSQLMALQQRRPEVAVNYSVTLGNTSYSCRASQIEVANITEEELSLLSCLPELKTVICGGGETTVIRQLQDYCRGNGLTFGIRIGEEAILDTVKTVSVNAISDDELLLLQFLTEMEQLHITAPKASAENLMQLKQSLGNVDISWEVELFGTRHASSETEVDLSGTKIDSVEQVKAALAYLPNVKQVFLGLCGLDNEALAAYREEVREKYKVVWTVQCGTKLTARTDDTTFMPVREYVYYFNDSEAYNLRYCEEMVCIDIGHMSVSDISFVESMPNLEYLILAHTQVQYIEPIRSCKKLKFLELDWSPIKDLSPLVDCTALEDLNLGNTYADFEPIGTMTWLKNLWMIGCSSGARYRMTQALPETKVMITGSATVANGWRNLNNYYAMRDLLGMAYMTW